MELELKLRQIKLCGLSYEGLEVTTGEKAKGRGAERWEEEEGGGKRDALVLKILLALFCGRHGCI